MLTFSIGLIVALTVRANVEGVQPQELNSPLFKIGSIKTPRKAKETVDGCAGFGSCCPGKNVNCVGRGPTQNNKSSERCFCDEDCFRLGDCCLDYRFACKTVDCQLSERWSEWTACDRLCGIGAQKRTRQVLVQPQNGGKKCGGHVERRMCEGFNCKPPPADHKRTHEAKVNETASIVPAIYASWRTNVLYNPLQDIRQSLFLHQLKYASLLNDKKPSYCATFRVTETRGACHKVVNGKGQNSTAGLPPLTRSLVVGQTICVECQPFGIVQRTSSGKCIGDGIVNRETKWNAVATPRCHGKWTMTSQHLVPCQCDPESETSFVFV